MPVLFVDTSILLVVPVHFVDPLVVPVHFVNRKYQAYPFQLHCIGRDIGRDISNFAVYYPVLGKFKAFELNFSLLAS